MRLLNKVPPAAAKSTKLKPFGSKLSQTLKKAMKDKVASQLER